MADVEVEARESAGLDASDTVCVDTLTVPEDVTGAGWSRYHHDYCVPTVTRQGERFRKDKWRWRRW